MEENTSLLTSFRKGGIQMPARTFHEKEICPFTLEPFGVCCDLKTTNEKRICPFSLEPCIFDSRVILNTRRHAC
jgi:hypothetical protein